MNVQGIFEHRYELMPPIEDTFANYLSMGEASSLKTQTLSSKPYHVTSHLNGNWSSWWGLTHDGCVTGVQAALLKELV